MNPTFAKSSISAALAMELLRAAEAAATRLDVAAVIAVVDESGVPKAMLRMDGAPLLSEGIAQDKAYTAASFGVPTDQWYGAIKDDPALLHGLAKTPRFIIFGGGLPIRIGNQLVGGIGVSGGTAEQDVEIASLALQSAS